MAEGSASTKKRRRRRKKDHEDQDGPAAATVGDLVAALDDATAHEREGDEGDEADEADEPDATGEDEKDEGTASDADEAAGGSDPGEEEAGEIPEGVQLSDTLPMAPEDDLSQVEGEASERLVSIVESLLFAAERPLTVKDIRRLLKDPSVRQIQLAVKALIGQTAERGVVLSQVAGGFRLRTHPNNAKYVQRMLAGRPARLSRSQLEALAVIAYRQPITKAEIDHVRGVDCSAVLRVLLERDLCRIVGRKEEAGRPILYGTTVEFLEFFNLKSLRDMPDLHEFRELTEDSRATLRERYGDDAEEIEAEVLGQQTLGLDVDGDTNADDDALSGDDDDDDGASANADDDALSGDADDDGASEDADEALTDVPTAAEGDDEPDGSTPDESDAPEETDDGSDHDDEADDAADASPEDDDDD